MDTEEILENLLLTINYFLPKQDEYDAIDKEYHMMKKAYEHKVKQWSISLKEYLLISFAISLVTDRKICLWINRMTGLKIPLYQDVLPLISTDKPNTFLFAFIPLGIIFSLLLLSFFLMRMAYEKFWDKCMTWHHKKMQPHINALYEHFEKFVESTGHICLMKSFQYCNPKELSSIYKLIASGKADSIPRAKQYLSHCGGLYDYSYINIFNRPQRNKNYASEEKREKTPNHFHSNSDESSKWFRGVDNGKDLKIRYYNLMKTYHTDGNAGDNEIAQEINDEYHRIKKQYE